MSVGRLGNDMEIGRKTMLKNEGSCNDGKVVLLKRYNAPNMESGKDASVLESRTVRMRRNKCQPLVREKINSAYSSPIKCFSTSKNLENTQRARRKIRGSNKKLSEGDQRLKRAKDTESRRWLYNSVVRERLDAAADSYSDTEEYFDGDVRSDLLEGFLCYLSQLEYGLSIPLSNLAKDIMNAIGACPVQLNENMWEVITVCDHLNEKWDKEGKVSRITPEDVLQFYGVKNYKAIMGPYFSASTPRHRFIDLNSAGRTWNDNVIWVKGNCLQRDDEEPLYLQFRTVKQSVKSKLERKESLLDKVMEEETKLEFVLEWHGLSRKKRVDSRSKSSAQPNPVMSSKIVLKYPKKRMLKEFLASGTTRSGEAAKEKRRRVKPSIESGEKVAEGRSTAVDDSKEVEERTRLAVLHGEEDTIRMVTRFIKEIWLGIEEEKTELKKENIELEKELARSRTDALMEVRQLKASHAVTIGQLQVEPKANPDEMVKERDRLGPYLMVKGYSKEEVDAIKADTYVEEEDEEEAEAVRIVDGLDGVSRQTVLDSQGDDAEIPEDNSEKALREMSLRIKDLEAGLARERKTFKALLSAQAELHVELDSSRSYEGDILMCNWEFAEQFDRMREASENREDQYVKAHFKLVEVTRAAFGQTLHVEEKDAKIGKGLKELVEITERVEKLQTRVDVLVVKGKQANAAQYSIQTLERSEERFLFDLQNCRNELEKMRQKFIKKDNELRVAQENLSASEAAAEHLQIALPTKDMDSKKYNEGRIRGLKSDVSHLLGHTKKGNVNLRECQQMLDVVLIGEKVLEEEIKVKESLMKRKEELLKDED
ncbi:hypothetical protein GIB67_006468 [Kingdonia uniflora]|uniref:Uncharacterized protein n=1 Tax=Kingdonia uniflora TaxID=39325 RepID=A0A7J7LEG6_9MAGN|nr:hypothetical protein GIB67_006468 [Kingdonia uniflora]